MYKTYNKNTNYEEYLQKHFNQQKIQVTPLITTNYYKDSLLINISYDETNTKYI